MSSRASLGFLLALTAVVLPACSRGDVVEADGGGSRQSLPAADAIGGVATEEAHSIGGFTGAAAPAPSRLTLKRGAERPAAPQSAPAPAPVQAPLPGANVPAVQDSAAAPMLIRTGDARVEVDSLERAIAAVQALAARAGATIGSTMQHGGRDAVRSATIELRVPAPRFDLLVNGLAPLGRVEHVNVHAQDVSEEFVDLSARVANARRLEARLVQLLATRTGRLEDVLAVERELARVREEIERYEGRLRFLRTRVAVSTLSVTVHERAPLVAMHPGARPMRDALVEAWRRFVATTAGVIVAIGALLPILLVAGLLALAGRSARRRWMALQDAHEQRATTGR